MNPSFARRPITALLESALAPSPADAPRSWKVDTARRPKGGGWQGDIGDSAFEPYAVLTALATSDLTVSAHPGGFGSGAPIALPYTITVVGVSPEQTEMLCDLLRARLIPLAGEEPEPNVFIMDALPARVGACQRIDQEHGEYWVQTDLVVVRISP